MVIQKSQSKDIKISGLQISERAKRALQGAGVETVSQLCEKTKKELLKIDGFGKTSLDEILLALRLLKLKLKKPVREVQNTDFEKYLITRYIKPGNYKTLNWGNEIKVARNLIKKYPKREFWEWYALTFKLNSLLFFFGGGKADLHHAYHSDQSKIPHVNSKKQEPQKEAPKELFGENIIIQKPKSIEDFLNED
jgi:hypothetical protein